MSSENRKWIARMTLAAYLREALSDGQIDENEKKGIAELTRHLGIDKATFDEVFQGIRSDLVTNPSAGALDPVVFFRRLTTQLRGAFSADEVEPVLRSLAGLMGLEDQFIEEKRSAIHAPESFGDEGKFRICSREGVNYVEVRLRNDSCRTEAGAMRYIRGDISMESHSPGVGGFFKAAFTGETAHKPVYSGTGLLVLEPSMSNFFRLDMNHEHFILDQGAYWASDMGLEISAYRNKALNALMSGEGWFQTSVQGSGTVIICAQGPVECLDLKNESLVVDGSFAVAREASLSFAVTRSTKSIWGSLTSGEGLVNTISGTGRVYLAPIPNKNLMLGKIFSMGISSATRK